MKPKKIKRPKLSKPVIPESGRVWAILIVSNDDAPGRMILQAVPHPTREWDFVDIGAR